MSVSFDRVADRYDATRGGEERGTWVAADLEPLFVASGLTLEVGVGTGIVAKALATRGRSVVGVDIAPAMLRHAQARLGPRVAVADAMRLPFGPATFADAFACHVMHLVADQAAVLEEVARVLLPGGRFVIVMVDPEPSNPVAEIVREAYRRLDPDRPERDQPERLVDLAEAAGFAAARTVRGTEITRSTSPITTAERLEERVFSALWRGPEEEVARVVADASARLRALGDRPVPSVARNVFVVLQKGNRVRS